MVVRDKKAAIVGAEGERRRRVRARIGMDVTTEC